MMISRLIRPLAVAAWCLTPCLAAEPMRPAFHYTSPVNWLNDPNGLVWHDGEYHLFFQYNPHGDIWGHMSWGHAISRDLLNWEHMPVAIPEKDGIMAFSGCAVVDVANTSGFGKDDVAPLVAIYTGHREGIQDQRLAYSTDKGRTWTMYEGNPVLDIGIADFRDPKVFWHEPTKRWVMAVALSLERKIAFYSSQNLKDWKPLSHFGPVGSVKGIWECPDLFEVPVEGTDRKRWMLTVNLGDAAPAGGSGAQYFTGTFDGQTFTADPLPPTPAAEPISSGKVIADFERSGYKGWEIEGEAFGTRPSSGTEDGQNPVGGYLGSGLVNSYGKGDAPTGRMTSPEFTLSGGFLNFLVGGGASPERLAVNLLVDGKVVHTATGRKSEELRWVAWPVAEFKGRTARIQLVDEESGEWGHLLFDHAVLSDKPARTPIENANWVDYGPDFYAAVTYSNAPLVDGRPTWLAWMSNWKYAVATPTSPWRSAMTLPRTISLRMEGGRARLIQHPIDQLEKLRRDPIRMSRLSIQEANKRLEDVRGTRFDMRLRIDPGGAEEVGIKLRVGGGQETLVGWSRASGEVFVDRTKSGNVDFHPDFSGKHGGAVTLQDGMVELRIITDDCSVEVFADGGAVCITDLIFPSASADGIEFYAKSGKPQIVAAEIYPLHPPEK